MGLDTFPLLQDQTTLFIYKNTVFKLKLEYQHVSQQMKGAFVEVVSERAAHCQIEDVCRALLYNIEREEPISPIQSEHFVIYPEVHGWPLANKVQFFVHGKQLSCHRDLILLKLYCKSIALPVPDQNQVDTSCSSVNKKKSPRLSPDTSQLKPTSEQSDKENASTSCSGNININNNKSSPEAVSSIKYKTPVSETSVARLYNGIEGIGPDSNHALPKLPEQHGSEVGSCDTSGDQYSSHTETSLGNSFTTETDAGNVSADKSKHKKTREPDLRVRCDHNVSRKIKHKVDEISKDNSRQSTQQAPKLPCSTLKSLTSLQTEQAPQNEISPKDNKTEQAPLSDMPHKDSETEHLYSTDVQILQVHPPHTPRRQSAQGNEEPSSDHYEVVYDKNLKVMPKRITRSELRKRYACKNSLREGFRKSQRRRVESGITRKVTTSSPYNSVVRSVKTFAHSKEVTLASTKKYTHGKNTSANVSNTIEGGIKHTGSSDDMKSLGSSEISGTDVVEVSVDGRTFYKSEQKIGHRRVTSVSPIVTLRDRKVKQNTSPNYSDDTNIHHGVRICRSRSAENDKAIRLPGQRNSKNIVCEKRQIKGHYDVSANRTNGEPSHISVRRQRIATKYNYSGKQRMPQTKYANSLKKKVVYLKTKEKATFNVNKQVSQITDSQRKSRSCDSVNQITRSYSVSSFAGETDTTCRSLRSARKDLLLSPQPSSKRGRKDLLLSPQPSSKRGRKDLLLSPQLRSNRGRNDVLLSPQLSSKRRNRVSDALVKAQQHLIASKDGVWLF